MTQEQVSLNRAKQQNHLRKIITDIESWFGPKYEKELYIGCYINSKQYLGTDGAKIYSQCTIDKLSTKFSDEEIDEVFSKEPDEIQQLTEFATIACEK